jgi:hypothetical protein
MKKVLTFLVVFVSMSLSSFAQVNPHAIGLRFGGNGDINGAEVSYQHALGESNRLEFDFGIKGHKYYNNMFLAVIYHWNWNITDGLNWYAGPGAAVGLYNYDNNQVISSGANLGVGGQIGIEYDFNHHGTPLLLSLDARPMFDLIGYYDIGWGTSLSLRYTF